jgi:DNA-binding NarL/FixJ family response regulator
MRILLCDDSAELRSLLRSAIADDRNPVGAAHDVEVVAEVGDGDTALRLAAEHQPDVVVLDLEMPGPAPAQLLRTLRRLAPRAAIVTFSGHDPAVVAGPAARVIALHLPKTTDLAAAGRAVRELGRRSVS